MTSWRLQQPRLWIFVLCLIAFVTSAYTDMPLTMLDEITISNQPIDLWQAYQDALRNDPLYQEQQAALQETEQSIPEARASLLPQLTYSSQISRTQQLSSIFTIGKNRFNSNQYSLNFSQAIFNVAALSNLKKAKASVQSAAALFSAQGQDLIVRVVRAYLAALQAKDLMLYTQEQVKFAKLFYTMTNKKFALKYATITDIDQAKQQYELLQAQYISTQISYYRALQDLSTITAKQYKQLTIFKKNFPLIKPHPFSMDAWVDLARRQNLNLRAAQYDVVAARDEITTQQANFIPNVSAMSSYSNANQLANIGIDNVVETVKSTVVGVDFSWNAIQGGLNIAQVRQASAAYARSMAVLRQRYLAAIVNTRKAYFGITEGISRVQSSRQAVLTGLSGLNYAQAGFRAGVQTIFDLLQAQNRLFEAEKQYLSDFYSYIIDTVLLKQATGTLSPEDVFQLNKWVTLSAQQSATVFPAPPLITVNKDQPAVRNQKLPPLSERVIK